jgi:mannose-6-phosphate isomerase-like protein (cupin superfamily)
MEHTSPLSPFIEKRPWGSFIQFTKNTPSTVKIISVYAGESLSLQYHHHRSEFWKVLSGSGKVTIGESILLAEKGNEFFIPKGILHRISAITDLEILEIALGDFDEADIIRTEDRYNRITNQ